MKNMVNLNVSLPLYTTAFFAAAIPIVITPDHEKKNTEEIAKIRKTTISENVMLDSKMQTSVNILALIDYLKGSRADTLKEAINLFLND